MSQIQSLPLAPADDIDFVLKKCVEMNLTAKLRGERLLLTGATGFFGKWMTQALLAMNDRLSLGNQITLLTRDIARAEATQPWLKNRKDLRLIEGDVRNFHTDQTFTRIIHGAASASHDLNVNAPEVMFDTIVDGTRRILGVAAKSKVRRVQVLSSGAVYGSQPLDLDHVSESYLGAPRALDPGSAYGEAKRVSEFLAGLEAKRSGFHLSIARCYAFVGPYLPLDSHFAAGNFLNDLIQNRPIRVQGDGTPRRSYLYAADLVVWLIAGFVRDETHIYNVGSDNSVSILELAKTADHVGKALIEARRDLGDSLSCGKTPTPGAFPSRYVPSVDLARKKYGLEVWTDLHESVRKTLLWHLTRSS